ncbi:tRNA modification GTPase TrmE [Ehrlichia chaffeensis str. Heartland]|uniref:tRNA modification GTPase MnmE n=1 Tax=Ehrlichia chaffeensis (strain ATCC CRL-10679 / Arkansas) TaxID=205920 RepID=MNME_EHRCR|nr:tRNA uridine-5-carboxymethylaminomethyl(34) synthesis GTPase MnmE [Ehrlichia chaffeensis]Q2GI42.1 RecName: Full=tRNA modification GTPase MnmE [Ehrlichia chaffeensis str. Arkansas]ABD45538.1 tRNA modification GTPase TrmE [Ehrlichia chaffeensis str. Arkansas]AHX04123.1 tRNA modification GTPase TrmE [Ehrlichia chaffeensis str. Heartland]AHX06059.1 tRNA modification GTPase TrmE [Ehrlichia chaffeensis str. Jax]AHX07049.1 tRNA modification GTPase TrmE [Ehrlichia chaffeensis str. Liberty]AHX07757
MTTIFALCTPWGRSGVAVIRISGEDAAKAFVHFGINSSIKPRTATFTPLYDKDGEVIDEAIVVYFVAPNSFTGEDVVEFHTHGSFAVIKMILAELGKIFVPAGPGEFSLRAFLNNKVDLTRAEAIVDLINSETEMQAKQAIRQMSGVLEKLYQNWRQQLIDILSNIEAYIDFPEEVNSSAIANIDYLLNNLQKSLESHLNDDRRGERLRQGIYVTILGEPNSGKSTLFNHLAKRDIAIVSEYAGTTRDPLEAHIDVAGYPIIIIDTAGIRESTDPVEQEGIKRAKLKAENADFKIVMLPYEKRDIFNREIMSLIDDKSICILSKADNITDQKLIPVFDFSFIPISVYCNIGIENLLNLIKQKVEKDFQFCNTDPFITSERQRKHIQNTLNIIKSVDLSLPMEIVSEDLRLSVRELGKVVGVISDDDILDNVFGKFCIGK